MKRIATMAVVLALAGCGGGDDLDWLDAAADDIARSNAAASAASADAAAPGDAEAHGATAAGAAGEADEATAASERRVVFVDVRQPDELAEGYVTGSIHIPHTELADRVAELEAYRDADIVLYCRTGRRSGIAEEILTQAGFQNLHNGGGFSDLQRRGVPTTR
jgi:phage shock protein E